MTNPNFPLGASPFPPLTPGLIPDISPVAYPGADFFPDIDEVGIPVTPPVTGVLLYSKTGVLYARNHLGELPIGGSALINPMTDIGDMIVGAAIGEPSRLPFGGANTVLANTAGADQSWVTALVLAALTTDALVFAGTAAPVDGSIGLTAVNGLTIQLAAGSSNDFAIMKAGGGVMVDIPNGGAGMTVHGFFEVAGGDLVADQRILVTGDIDGSANIKATGNFACNGASPAPPQVSGGTLPGVIAGLVAIGLFSS